MCLTDETFIAQHETNGLQSGVKYYNYTESLDFRQYVFAVKTKSQSALWSGDSQPFPIMPWVL